MQYSFSNIEVAMMNPVLQQHHHLIACQHQCPISHAAVLQMKGLGLSRAISASPPTTILTIDAWKDVQSERLLSCIQNNDYFNFKVRTILRRWPTSMHTQAFWKLQCKEMEQVF